MLIRKTEYADAVKLPDIEQSAGQIFKQIPEFAWISDSATMSAKQHQVFIEAGTSWVAQDDNELLCGFLCAEIIRDALHICELSVTEGYQGKGIGSALIEEAVCQAAFLGLSSLTLTTFRSVPWNAPFYTRLGFVELMSDDITDPLQYILDDEINRGLPEGERCAMRYSL
jgi:GNAT superfamily N-acetyltransferase